MRQSHRRLLECDMTRPSSHRSTAQKSDNVLTAVLFKASFTILLAAVLGAVATPVDNVIHRRFTCEKRLEGYCHASNVGSYCENGQFRSKAYETCSRYCRYDKTHTHVAGFPKT